MLTNDEKREFADVALSTFDLEPLQPIDTNKAIDSLIQEIDDSFALNSAEVKRARAEHFSIPGAKVEDYAEKIFKIDSRRSVIAGIRHLSGDKEKPFIAIKPNFSIEKMEDLLAISSKVSTSFNIFATKFLNIWLRPKSSISCELGKFIVPGQAYVAARSENLKIDLVEKDEPQLELIPVNEEFNWNWYKQTYKEFHDEQPDLASWVPVNENEEMQECQKDGLLFYIFVKNKLAGVVAGKKESLLGASAVYVVELLLSRPYKGKGLAPVVQKKFIKQLPKETELIWGTIDSKNLPSTKTALRVGRRIIRKEYFVPLDQIL